MSGSRGFGFVTVLQVFVSLQSYFNTRSRGSTKKKMKAVWWLDTIPYRTSGV